jgi:hypothetical protein
LGATSTTSDRSIKKVKVDRNSSKVRTSPGLMKHRQLKNNGALGDFQMFEPLSVWLNIRGWDYLPKLSSSSLYKLGNADCEA